MSSFIAYYRPRGIVGNYVVGIFLDLAKTETAKVTVSRRRCPNCKHCGIQNPDSVTPIVNPDRNWDQSSHRTLEAYRVNALVTGDSITVEVLDKDIAPYQYSTFRAASDWGIDRKGEGIFEIKSPAYVKDISYGKFTLNPILLVDWDKQMFEYDTENKRVEDVLFASN